MKNIRSLQVAKHLRLPSALLLALTLGGCGAIFTKASKSELVLQTQASDAIFFEPYPASHKSVYLNVRDTTGKNVDVAGPIAGALLVKGYKIVEDPADAFFVLQAQVVRVEQSDLREAQRLLGEGGPGSDAGGTGAGIGALLAATADGNQEAVVGATLLGGLIGTLFDASVKDILFVMVTDVEMRQLVTEGSDKGWNKHSTQIISTANKVNLEFDEAVFGLTSELGKSISGFLN